MLWPVVKHGLFIGLTSQTWWRISGQNYWRTITSSSFTMGYTYSNRTVYTQNTLPLLLNTVKCTMQCIIGSLYLSNFKTLLLQLLLLQIQLLLPLLLLLFLPLLQLLVLLLQLLVLLLLWPLLLILLLLLTLLLQLLILVPQLLLLRLLGAKYFCRGGLIYPGRVDVVCRHYGNPNNTGWLSSHQGTGLAEEA